MRRRRLCQSETRSSWDSARVSPLYNLAVAALLTYALRLLSFYTVGAQEEALVRLKGRAVQGAARLGTKAYACCR